MHCSIFKCFWDAMWQLDVRWVTVTLLTDDWLLQMLLMWLLATAVSQVKLMRTAVMLTTPCKRLSSSSHTDVIAAMLRQRCCAASALLRCVSAAALHQRCCAVIVSTSCHLHLPAVIILVANIQLLPSVLLLFLLPTYIPCDTLYKFYYNGIHVREKLSVLSWSLAGLL